ncbi:MAG: Zn-ribbon domain-containing OB-fold protein [Actinobacteria bacterium]|nr:Zn-ribbon domain-containing OB-fold protein [Actinomycetota bacterium]
MPDVALRPRPTVTALTEPFWAGTRAGELRVQRCSDCGRLRWTPLSACPSCWSERARWVPMSGRATVHTFTVVHRAMDPRAFSAPYVLAVVELDEGPHMLTNLVDVDPDEVRVGMPVIVRFERVDDEITVYPFSPA